MVFPKNRLVQSRKLTLLALAAILLTGSALRLIYLGKIPGGMHQDEAFSAWTALSLLRDRIDSAGNYLPVYLAGWGDGQSALYSWLMIPFLLIAGDWSPLVSRLPQALVGIFTILSVFFLFREMFDEAAGLWASFLLAVCPWHIMMCRWGLEANLAPGFLIFGFTFFIKGLKNNACFLLSALFYGLSLYCYAVLWPVVPVILILQTIYGIVLRKIRLNRFTVSSVLLLFVLALPLILFVIVNTLHLEAIRLPFLTIPVMPGFRGGEVALSFSEMQDNWDRAYKLLRYQKPRNPYDLLLPYGLFYNIGRIFILVGLLALVLSMLRKFLRREFSHEFFLFAHLIGAGLNVLLVTAYLHQINSLYILLVLCQAYGVWSVLKLLRRVDRRIPVCAAALLTAVYLWNLAGFQRAYYTEYRELAGTYFYEDLEDCVSYALHASQNADSATHPGVIFDSAAQWPRILLYTRTSAPEYLNTVSYRENHVEPASFSREGTVFYNGIDFDSLREDAVYILYFPDAPRFEENYTLTRFRDWYCAVPKAFED